MNGARAETRHHVWAVLVAAQAVLTPVGASAQAPRVLRVDAPASCGGEPELRARIDAQVAGACVVEMPVLDATLTIEELAGSFRASLIVREGGLETRRAFVDARCAVVLDAAALVLAFALVPGLADADAAPRPDPDVADRPAAEPEIAAPDPEGAPTDAAPSVSGAVRLSAHGSVGVLPGVVIGGELAGAVIVDWLRVELGVRGTPFAGARFATAVGSLGGDLGMAAALVRGCAMASPAPIVELGGCIGLEAGAAFGHGVGLTAPTDAAAPWVALEGALRAAWIPWPFIAFVLEIQALAPVVRPVFTVAGLGVLYRPEPVSAAVRLGLELRFR